MRREREFAFCRCKEIYDPNDLDLRLTDGGGLIHSYANDGEVKMSKQEIIEMIERAGFEAVERDTVYNRLEKVIV